MIKQLRLTKFISKQTEQESNKDNLLGDLNIVLFLLI